MGGSEKKAWIEKFAGETGSVLDLQKAADRVAILCKALSGKDPMTCATTSPFVTGMGLSHPVENGFLWHHSLGVPFLPASSVKGMIKAWARDWLESTPEHAATVARLFGRDCKHDEGAGAGSLIVFDALPTTPVNLVTEVITPHDGGWRHKEPTSANAPADWISPVPIPFLVVAPGAVFQFCFATRSGALDGDLELAYEYLGDALEWIGAGAKTATGFGRMLDEKTIRELEQEAEKLQRDLKLAQASAQKEAAEKAPPTPGQKAFHDDWGTVEVLSVDGDTVLVYSRDEAQEVFVDLTELKKT